MTFFERIFIAMVTTGLALVTAACSDDSKKDASAKQGAQAACEHINEVCASTEGFRRQDCSTANASYEKLNASQKGEADAIALCVLSATSCQPAIDCVSPPSYDSPTSEDDEERPSHDTEDACEHINALCENERGFTTQDCSSSLSDYEKLSDDDKELADAITPCIMNAETCKDAFACLKFD